MAKRREAPAQDDDVSELRREIADLTDHVRLLVDILDRIYDELSWITRNDLPLQCPAPPGPQPHVVGDRPIVLPPDAASQCTPPESSAPTAQPTVNAAVETTAAGKGRLF